MIHTCPRFAVGAVCPNGYPDPQGFGVSADNGNIGHSKITGHAQSKFIFRFQAEHLTPSSSAFPTAPPLRRDIVKVAGENTRQIWLCSSGNRTVIPSIGQSVCNTQYLPRIPWRLQIGFARSKLMGRQNKIDAKRRNASKSTGPKTPEEKTAVSLNALRPRRSRAGWATRVRLRSRMGSVLYYRPTPVKYGVGSEVNESASNFAVAPFAPWAVSP